MIDLSTATESQRPIAFVDTRSSAKFREVISTQITRESIPESSSAAATRLLHKSESKSRSSDSSSGSVISEPDTAGLLSTALPFNVSPGAELWPIDGMKKWEGRVIEVDGALFSAELTPIDEDGVPWIADFKTRLLDAEDGGPKPGDMFYLTVRRIQRRGGDVTTSSIRIKRLGKWTRRDIDEIELRARRRAEMLAANAE